MKKITKKLNLGRETVRNLDSGALGSVAGGRRTSDITVSCPSVDICPTLDPGCDGFKLR